MVHFCKQHLGRGSLLAALIVVSATGPVVAQNAAGAAGAGNAAGTAGAPGGVGVAGAGAPGTAGTGNATPGGAPGTAMSGANGTIGTAGTGTSASGALGTGVSGLGGTISSGTASSSAGSGSVPVSSSSAPQAYTLSHTIADALRASADVQTATRTVQIDQKLADAAAARGKPNVDGVASATRFDQATKVSIGGGPPIQVLPSHEELLQLNLGEDFDIAGQIRAATDQYHLQSLADKDILQQIRDARILDAQTIYFNLLRADHQVQVAQANLADAVQNQKDAQNLFNAGTGQKIDLLRANTQVAQAQQQVTQSLDEQGIAQSNFNDLVGRPIQTPVTLTDVPGVSVGSAPSTAIAVGAPTNISLYLPPANAVSAINLNQSIKAAYIDRPEILADQIDIQVARNGLTLARSGLAPSLNVDAAANYYPTTSFQEPRQRTAQVTATLTIPIYDGNGTQDQVAAARLRQKNAETLLASEKTNVSLQVSQAYLNLLTADEQISAANTALQQAIAARQLAQIRYQGGVGLFLEVTDAQAALTQAENSQINAVYDYLVARAQFENAVGTPHIP